LLNPVTKERFAFVASSVLRVVVQISFHKCLNTSYQRIIAKDAQGREHRYILEDGRLTEKP
jgi:hypothetical protein